MDIEKGIDLATPGAAVAVAWSPDGSTLAAASNYGETLTVWSSAGKRINQFSRIGGGPALAGSLAFFNGSSKLIFPPPANSSDSVALAIWDIRTGTVSGEINDPRPGWNYSVNRAPYFQVSPQEDILVAGSNNSDKNIISYRIPSWEVLSTGSVKDAIFALSLFAQGRLAVVGSNQGRVTIFDANTDSQILTLQVYQESDYGDVSIGAVAGSPDGSLIFAGAGLITITGKYINTPETKAWRSGLSSGCVLSIQDKRCIASISGARNPIRKAVWDPRGRYVAFVDDDGALYFWQPLACAEAYKVAKLSSQGLSLSISPDGGKIAATTSYGVSLFSVK